MPDTRSAPRDPASAGTLSDPTERDLQSLAGPINRRTALAGAGIAGATLVLAACGGSNGSSSSSTTSAAATTDAAPSAASTTAAAGTKLGATADVPVGGGKIFGAHKVVVVQTTAGVFSGYSAVCTHQGCLVNKVASGTIDCPCHGSKFSASDGSVSHGPAASPLASKSIEVRGDSLYLV